MSHRETLHQERLVRETERARRAAERAEQTAEERVTRDSQRAEQAATAVIAVTRGTGWPPPFANLDQLAQAAYTSNGLSTDSWFGEQRQNKAGKPMGYERFRSSIRSEWVRAVLADEGIVLYVTKDGAGVPDREAVVEYHERQRERLQQLIDRENEKAEQESAVFGMAIPMFEQRALTDGRPAA